ncbi:hypothetical protein QFZ32_000167 [Streptomyces canus]|nr:hypothetical protein [Streptomyces canus]
MAWKAGAVGRPPLERQAEHFLAFVGVAAALIGYRGLTA